MGRSVFRGLLSVACGLILSPIANADVLNFTSGGASWFHGAYFNSDIDQAGGNGLLDPFVELSGSKGDITYAYNSDATQQNLPVMESTNAEPKNNAIQVKDIPIAMGVDGQLYFEFLLDVNEPGAENNRTKNLISLDDLRLYTGATSDPVVTNPDNLGTLQYALGGNAIWNGLASPGNPIGTNNHILLDYNRYSGSGVADLMVYIPVWYTDGGGQPLIGQAGKNYLSTITEYVYLYSVLGAYGGDYIQDSNDDNWGLRLNNAPPTDIPIEPQGGVVPEPTSLALAGFAGIGFALRALRRRRSPKSDQAA